MSDKREMIAVMSSNTWEAIKKRSIEEALLHDDPMEYLLQHEPNIVIDDDLDDGIVQTWYRDVYEAMMRDDDDDDFEF